MNYILIANTTTSTIDYYTLGVTLIAILIIIVGLRRIIRGSRKKDDEIYDIQTPEFHERAKEISGLDWDFSRLGDGNYICCVESCNFTRLWGHWTCERHVEYEKMYFHPVDESGNIFWSHKGLRVDV